MMSQKNFFGLALCGCALTSGVSAILEALTLGTAGAVTGTAIGGAATSTVFVTSGGAALIGAAVLLKGLAAAAIAAPALSRGKRHAHLDESDFAFATLAGTEPGQCYRRLICDLATGSMPKSDNDQIMVLFNGPVAPESPKFDFATAAAVGKKTKSVQMCELRYSCPLSSNQIAKLFN